MKLRLLVSIIFSFFCLGIQGQAVFEFEVAWKTGHSSFEWENEVLEVPSFWAAAHHEPLAFAPLLVAKYPLPKGQTITNVTVEVLESEAQERGSTSFLQKQACPEPGFIQWHQREERGKAVVLIEYFPLAGSKSGSLEKVLKGRFRVNTIPRAAASMAKAGFTSSSVLATGDWYRLAVVNDGVHRIDRSMLQTLGIDVNQLNPQDLNIFGNGFGQLPFENSIERPDDLLLNNIFIEGEGDGSFDEGDYILFFARGPHTWSYDPQSALFDHNKNDYSDTSYYFIGINTGLSPSRISNLNQSGAAANYTVSSFNAFTFHEADRENLLKSGREWYGEKFDVQTVYNFSGTQFNFPNILPGSTTVRANVAARRLVSGNSIFTMEVNGQSVSQTVPQVGTGSASAFANSRNLALVIENSTPSLNINFTFDKAGVPSSAGWLNWFNINTRRSLIMNGTQMMFRDVESVAPGRVSRFEIGNAGSIQEVWEITDPYNVRRVSMIISGNTGTFTLATPNLREFIAFTGGNYLTPVPAGKIANQNLHALGLDQRLDMVIVSPNQLVSQAEDLANIHRNYEADPLNVEVVKLQQVYNEFSSGMRDITAIKWLMKMLYERAAGNENMMPRYLLLFGDGSFDNRNTTPGNTNLVPTFQSLNSLSPVNSYVSDDYFGILGDAEGESALDVLDIGVGRITVKNQQEAISVVNKIRRYIEVEGNILDNCTTCNDGGGGFSSWRNVITLVADDEDNNEHMRNSQTISNRINGYTRTFNLERIFIDAFQQIATPGGARYPDVNKAIDRRVRNGAFIMNYIGHGGVLGWAQERILDIPTILDWDNQFAMPIFMTATCEFTRFDDPLRTSAGEYVLLNGNGGGIALMTTTRLVYSGPNFALNERFYDALFIRPPGEIVTRLGDVSRDTKNASLSSAGGSSNHRNFSLIGDPALPMALPKNQISITAITDTLGNPVDTLKALAVVRVYGEVRSPSGSVLSNFNGRLNSTVFDREKDVVTLANDGGTPFEFVQQEDIVFRGNAEVINGKFSFDFVIPKDISFAVDSTARISLYAFSNDQDGVGYIDDLNIGDRDPNAIDDGTGPDLNIFLNDENFVFGGFTNSTPTLIAQVFDKSGINTVGTGVGHDITATLDGDPKQTVVLNDFYEADLNTYQSGRVIYQFDELEPGNHELSMKIWNVHNRSSEEKTAFIVAENEEFAIERVLNYPNPFTTRTEFFFEHNQSCAFLNILIQVYTVSGKLVKSIVTVSNTDGFRTEPVQWDGRDDFGDRLATGVYVYKVSVRNPAGEQVEKFEKLVILN